MGKFTRRIKIQICTGTAIVLCCCFGCNTPVSINNGLGAEAIKESAYENEIAFRQKVISSAGRWKGVVELTGHNDHPMIAQALMFCGIDYPAPWCAACNAEILNYAGVNAPHSAYVPDWFNSNVIWKSQWGEYPFPVLPGTSVGFYFPSLKRYAHIGIVVAEDRNNYYTYQGNTSPFGQWKPETFELISNTDSLIVRDAGNGGGFYPKVVSKNSVSVMADYCLDSTQFNMRYKKYINIHGN